MLSVDQNVATPSGAIFGPCYRSLITRSRLADRHLRLQERVSYRFQRQFPPSDNLSHEDFHLSEPESITPVQCGTYTTGLMGHFLIIIKSSISCQLAPIYGATPPCSSHPHAINSWLIDSSTCKYPQCWDWLAQEPKSSGNKAWKYCTPRSSIVGQRVRESGTNLGWEARVLL